MNYLLYDLYSILTEIYILISASILLIYGVFFTTSMKLGYPLLNKNLSLLIAQTIIFGLVLMLTQEYINLVSWNSFLILDNFSFGAKIILLIAVFGWFCLVSQYSIQQKLNAFEFWILVLLVIVAMLFIIQVYDLLSIYLIIEFQSLIFYIFASFNRTSEFSTEAGLKYFILGAFASALLLFGSSLLYGFTGLTNLNDFSKLFTGFIFVDTFNFIGILTGLTFIISALLFKLSASPFHMWTPDVYEGSNIIVTAFFSILPKLVIFSIFFRLLFFAFHDLVEYWNFIILICALFSLIIGTLGAFMQIKWKRFMAYSSINHVGFLLLALATGSNDSVSSITFYIFVYMITTLGIFSFVMSLKNYTYPKIQQSRYLDNLLMLSIVNPLLAISMAVFLFSMAGIPPLAGFFSKLLILITAIKSNIIGISLVAIIVNCIACFYYIRLIKGMYFDHKKHWPILVPISKSISLVLGLSLIFLIFLTGDLELILLLSTSMAL
uniref:Nad2 n=1 Tax=Pterocladia lucida TaxID=31408 RepID=A0A6M3WWN7_PTELU|nr:Nad2 [Pterocladia lucida]